MGFGDIAHRARTSTRSPSAKGVCDDCGGWFNLVDLQKQMEYYGRTIQWTGYLVCRDCLDEPQPQLQPYILPPDPVPVRYPRPENFFSDNTLQGFTSLLIWPTATPFAFVTYLSGQNGNLVLDQNGHPIIVSSGADPISVLGQIATQSKTPVPGTAADKSTNLGAANTAQQILAPNGARTYLAIFNPTAWIAGVSLGIASFTDPLTVPLGSGAALFWSVGTNGPLPLGAISAISRLVDAPLWIWEG